MLKSTEVLLYCNGYGVNPIAAQINQVFVLNSLYSASKSRYTADQGRAAENWIQVSVTGVTLSGVHGPCEVTVQKFLTGSTSVVEGK